MCKPRHRVEHSISDYDSPADHVQRPDRQPATERVGDRDRDRVAAVLKAALSEGLLNLAEFEERLTAAWSARTRGQLTAVTGDLPRGWGRDHATAARQVAHARRSGTTLRYAIAAFTIAMLVMVSIWLLTGAGYAWPVWPALGWAPWLMFHRQATRGCARRPRPDAS